MVKAGPPVDEMIAHLKPFLDKGDIIVDGGNSYYVDTERRYFAIVLSSIVCTQILYVDAKPWRMKDFVL